MCACAEVVYLEGVFLCVEMVYVEGMLMCRGCIYTQGCARVDVLYLEVYARVWRLYVDWVADVRRVCM